MAVNSDQSLALRHVAYVAASGNGKGIAIKHLGLIPAKPRLLIFDPYGEYEYEKGNVFSGLGGKVVYHYYDRASFAKAAIHAWRSGKSFRVAYTPKTRADRTELLWFAQLVWDMSDGKKQLDVIFGELAKLVESVAKETSILGEIYTGGRQFNIVAHADFQRSQEIPKTVWGNTPNKVIGGQESTLDANKMKDELSCELAEIKMLGVLNAKYKDEKGRFTKLHYLFKEPGLGNYSSKSINLAFSVPRVENGVNK